MQMLYYISALCINEYVYEIDKDILDTVNSYTINYIYNSRIILSF